MSWDTKGGQPRAFYVKFVGEGVDDHGGPYRAVFQSALGDEPRAVLGLLTASDADGGLAPGETLATGGRQRSSRQKRFAALYAHLGRLLGVAGRHRVLGQRHHGIYIELRIQGTFRV